MLFADHVPHEVWALQALPYLLLLVLGVVLGLLIMRARMKGLRADDRELLRSCIQRIGTKNLVEGARYHVRSILAPLNGQPETLVVLVLEAFIHLGSPVPEMMLEVHLIPDTHVLLKRKLLDGKRTYMEWKNGRPLFE